MVNPDNNATQTQPEASLPTSAASAQMNIQSRDLAVAYRQLASLYVKASKCGLARELEYLAELIVHLLHEEICPIDELHEVLVTNSLECSKTFKPVVELSERESNKLSDLENKRKVLIREWKWRRVRSLYLQGRYFVVLDEIDKMLGETFFTWNYVTTTQTVEVEQNNQELGTNNLDGGKGNEADYTEMRYALLKCFTLEKLQKFGDLMSFSSTFVRYLNTSCSYKVQQPFDKPSSTHKTLMRNKFVSKVFALQGRVLQYNGMNDLAVDCYIQAVTTSLSDVPWVLPILIGTHRLSHLQEVQLIDRLASADSCPLSRIIFEPFRYVMSHWVGANKDDAEDQSSTSCVHFGIRESPDFWDLAACKLVDSGSMLDAYHLCSSILDRSGPFKFRWRLHRIQAETLFFFHQHENFGNRNLLCLKTLELSGWIERSEYWFASGLLSMSESKFLEAVEEFNHGLEKLPAALLSSQSQSEIELFLLLYKMICWFRLGEVESARETIESMQLKYSNSPFTKLYSTRIQLACAALLQSQCQAPQCPDAVAQVKRQHLPFNSQCWSKAPILWRNPLHDEANGDVAICHERHDIACNYYSQAFDSLCNASTDAPIIVDRFSQWHCLSLPHFHHIYFVMIRVAFKLTLVLSKLRYFDEARNALHSGLTKLANSTVPIDDRQLDTANVIAAFIPNESSDVNQQLFQIFFSLPTIHPFFPPFGNSIYNQLRMTAKALQFIAQGVVDNPGNLEFSFLQNIPNFREF